MMCINLQETNLLIEFFRDHIADDSRGVKNLVDKIDFYNEEDLILEENPTHN